MNIDRYDIAENEEPIVKGGQGRTAESLVTDTKVCAICAIVMTLTVIGMAIYSILGGGR